MLLQIKYMKQTKVLSAGNLNKKLRFLFCSVLTYTYICTHETGNDIRRRLGHKAQTND